MGFPSWDFRCSLLICVRDSCFELGFAVLDFRFGILESRFGFGISVKEFRFPIVDVWIRQGGGGGVRWGREGRSVLGYRFRNVDCRSSDVAFGIWNLGVGCWFIALGYSIWDCRFALFGFGISDLALVRKKGTGGWGKGWRGGGGKKGRGNKHFNLQVPILDSWNQIVLFVFALRCLICVFNVRVCIFNSWIQNCLFRFSISDLGLSIFDVRCLVLDLEIPP